MPVMRKRSRAGESPANTPQPGSATNDDQLQTQTQKISEYELSREQRIRENRERMGKLGIMDLSRKLKSQLPPPPKRAGINSSDHRTPPTVQPSGPLRRSSRLQNAGPVSYSEVPMKKDKPLKNGKVLIEAGSKPEVYTEEHEKLLGNTEKSWTLFVDGYGKDGKRIYDSIGGKTCHQCRQKTLGYRTHCSKCNMVQGQFCGDCLYMRYGEHVLESLQNPTWICPVCRGICNCSLCRQAKGWAPTGPLYKKISALGYKSVAHYLIQTRRADKDEKENESIEVGENHLESLKPVDECDGDRVSAKRSLPFSDEMNDSKESLGVYENHIGSLNPVANSDGDEASAKRSLLFSDVQDQLEKVECSDTMKPLASSSKPCSDGIAGRLRPRNSKK